jgi:hypothetical protein
MSEKIKLEAVDYSATMTAPTRIQTLEADVKIEAKYKGEPEFTVVSDTGMARGQVKSEAGQWEMVPAGKEMEERRVTITPKNIAWYKSRTDVKSMKAGPGDFMGTPGEKFKLDASKSRTMKVRKEEAGAAKSRKLAKLTV